MDFSKLFSMTPAEFAAWTKAMNQAINEAKEEVRK